MAGTIPLSMTQQFDVYGKPLKGGQLYIIQVGTVSTPQDAFQDTALSVKHPYPMTLDAAGRIPQFFLADGSVKIRLQDSAGVVQLSSDSVLVIGPSAGGGGGSTVDPTQLIQTGMMMFRHGVGQIGGFVRLNGLSMGSATSGATERANLDVQALFLTLWPDTALAVSGGRGANAAADWTANKQLFLPDWRGYALGALDDMGNTPSGRLTIPYFGSSPIVLGAVGGAESRQLTAAQCAVPLHQHPVYLRDFGHAHNTNVLLFTADTGGPARVAAHNTGSTGTIDLPSQAAFTNITIGSVNGVANDNLTAAATVAVAASAVAAIGPRKLVTFYMKL